MLRLFNTYGKTIETFRPVNKKVITIFTCGPSVYQRSHIGNFRTFLFEDVLVRYLEFSGHTVKRGMTVTDIEDKAIEEAAKRKTTVKRLADKNIRVFIREMKLLKMKIPDFLPRASDNVGQAADIIKQLLVRGVAYRYRGNIYFDPKKFPGFGRLYGLDMAQWPSRKKRFHKDTYPGMRWNRGDFILWHGGGHGDADCLETEIGMGRPSWNVQDPSMVARFFNETLSAYCGGIDNLVRHHDYSRAILESVRPYPMARFWLHCYHLHVDGRKMSKSIGNIVYAETLLKEGYSPEEIRFFLVYGHYRKDLDYSGKSMNSAVSVLRDFKNKIRAIRRRAGTSPPDKTMADKVKEIFIREMDDDLNTKAAFDGLRDLLSCTDTDRLEPKEASGIIAGLKETDKVYRVIS
ncbi:MAG: class I tRNA ligase family protein [Thermodesulfovibrionales bacterium]